MRNCKLWSLTKKNNGKNFQKQLKAKDMKSKKQKVSSRLRSFLWFFPTLFFATILCFAQTIDCFRRTVPWFNK